MIGTTIPVTETTSTLTENISSTPINSTNESHTSVIGTTIPVKETTSTVTETSASTPIDSSVTESHTSMIGTTIEVIESISTVIETSASAPIHSTVTENHTSVIGPTIPVTESSSTVRETSSSTPISSAKTESHLSVIGTRIPVTESSSKVTENSSSTPISTTINDSHISVKETTIPVTESSSTAKQTSASTPIASTITESHTSVIGTTIPVTETTSTVTETSTSTPIGSTVTESHISVIGSTIPVTKSSSTVKENNASTPISSTVTESYISGSTIPVTESSSTVTENSSSTPINSTNESHTSVIGTSIPVIETTSTVTETSTSTPTASTVTQRQTSVIGSTIPMKKSSSAATETSSSTPIRSTVTESHTSVIRSTVPVTESTITAAETSASTPIGSTVTESHTSVIRTTIPLTESTSTITETSASILINSTVTESHTSVVGTTIPVTVNTSTATENSSSTPISSSITESHISVIGPTLRVTESTSTVTENSSRTPISSTVTESHLSVIGTTVPVTDSTSTVIENSSSTPLSNIVTENHTSVVASTISMTQNTSTATIRGLESTDTAAETRSSITVSNLVTESSTSEIVGTFLMSKSSSTAADSSTGIPVSNMVTETSMSVTGSAVPVIESSSTAADSSTGIPVSNIVTETSMSVIGSAVPVIESSSTAADSSTGIPVSNMVTETSMSVIGSAVPVIESTSTTSVSSSATPLSDIETETSTSIIRRTVPMSESTSTVSETKSSSLVTNKVTESHTSVLGSKTPVTESTSTAAGTNSATPVSNTEKESRTSATGISVPVSESSSTEAGTRSASSVIYTVSQSSRAVTSRGESESPFTTGNTATAGINNPSASSSSPGFTSYVTPESSTVWRENISTATQTKSSIPTGFTITNGSTIQSSVIINTSTTPIPFTYVTLSTSRTSANPAIVASTTQTNVTSSVPDGHMTSVTPVTNPGLVPLNNVTSPVPDGYTTSVIPATSIHSTPSHSITSAVLEGHTTSVTPATNTNSIPSYNATSAVSGSANTLLPSSISAVVRNESSTLSERQTVTVISHTATSGNATPTNNNNSIIASTTIQSSTSSSTKIIIPTRKEQLTSTRASTTTNAFNSVALYPYGKQTGDTEFVQRKVDFNSRLFKPEIGFPFGQRLRNSLYYTDNGQIIFPLSDNDIFSYSNPPAGGFQNGFKTAMVAAFWDDADFSKNTGTTYYQEYNAVNSAGNAVVRDVESKIRKYMTTSYTAEWTLKITWENAPAYPARVNDAQTNTYQAVLTTDGEASYVLILFKDGGMNWSVANRAATNVLVGYSSGEPDGFFRNDDLTQRPPAEKYRPANFKGFNSDLRGLWIYKLALAAPVNYRLKCQKWLNVQPNPRAWNAGLLPCPCSYWQGQFDFRFWRTRAGQFSSSVLLRSTFPNWYNAGVRCLYNRRNQLLQGYQERTWTFSPHILSENDPELEAYDWCCNRVDDPGFCARYSQRRPSIGCSGYRPLFPGWMYGDPHITTLDGLSYTFNGLGDFTLLKASDPDSSFIFQGRTVQTGTAKATNFMAFAAQYIASTTNTVEWILEKDDNIRVLLNNQNVAFNYSEDMETEIYNGEKILLIKNISITAVFEGNVSVSVSASNGILSGSSSLPSHYINKTVGLLGAWNMNQDDDFQKPDGTTIPTDSTERAIFEYGMMWQVGGDGLFSYSPPLARSGRSGAFVPAFLSDLQSGNATQYEMFATACSNRLDCVYDAMSTGNISLGLQTERIASDFQGVNTTLNSYPPAISGNSSIMAYIFQKVEAQYSANGTGIRFTAYTSLDLNVTENGHLVWTPTSASAFTVQIEAVDSSNLSSVFQPTFTLCRCRSILECNYSNTVRTNESSLYVAACSCKDDYSGEFCQAAPDPCVQGCFPGVPCNASTGCGPCPAGLTGDGLHCSDINECLQNSSCSPHATCSNTAPNYSCSCNVGFTGNGTFCQDLDECQSSPCSANATCSNTDGSYRCVCKEGFTGNGMSCSRPACGTVTCPTNYCSNGGTCSLAASDCTPSCKCPPAFSDKNCVLAGNDFMPEPLSDLPRRTIKLIFNSTENLVNRTEDVDSFVAVTMGTLPVKAFYTNSNITVLNATVSLISEFNYTGNITVIKFVNERLIPAVEAAFQTGRSRRALTPQQLRFLSTENVYNLSESELTKYFTCNSIGYSGYELNVTTFMCESLCKGYCQNGGVCKHMKDGPVCSCVPFSIYSPFGERCQNLSMNLAAFFGILFGSLAFLFLLMLAAFLAIYCYKKRNQWPGDDESLLKTDFFWKSAPFSPFSKMEDTILGSAPSPNEPSLKSWRPKLDKIDPSALSKIERPSLKTGVGSPEA
ncbi:mucin-4 [Rhinatrema bivittatum]|uniref:mucin-4 n=1 Tax=Rhinatrema bivittatum TaxID=194408 RepID=UPI00112E033E|nr:mucin-4 [Rhinatrema bivittatum]